MSSRELELSLHPRQPPLLRSIPPIEQISLYRSDESKEEKETREALQLSLSDPSPATNAASQKAPEVTQPPPIHRGVARTDSVEVQQRVAQLNMESTPTPSRVTNVTAIDLAAISQTGETIGAVAQEEPVPMPREKEPEVVRSYKPPDWAVQPSTSTSDARPLIPQSDEQLDEDEDEEMPSIDMRSDSEDDDANEE